MADAAVTSASQIPASTGPQSASAAGSNPADAIAAAAVSLSGKTWGTLGTTFAGAIIAAAGWANSMKNDIQDSNRKLDATTVKLDVVVEKLGAMEKRFEKIEDRMLSVERRTHGNGKPPNDDGGG